MWSQIRFLFIILFLSGCGIVTSVDNDNKESKILSIVKGYLLKKDYSL